MSFERVNIKKMQGYTPGEQPDRDDVIKLNTNENPYPPTQAVADALQQISVAQLRRYPSPTAIEFRQSLADYHSLSVSNIVATNGGDELLRLVLTTFADSGDTVAVAEPSYSLYPVLANIHGCKFHRIPLEQNWQLAEDFAQQLKQIGAKIAFIVNPHAPTGHLLSADKLCQIARQFNGLLLVDEAYVDFIDPEQQYDLVAHIPELDNVLILRTLSKGYSLAGLRMGYGIAASSIIEPILEKTRDSYNTDFISQQLATAAIESRADAASNWQKIRQQRLQLTQQLQGFGFDVLPSQANFVLAQAPAGFDAKTLCERLKAQRVLVRYFDQPRLQDKLRISIGTEQENAILLKQLSRLLKR